MSKIIIPTQQQVIRTNREIEIEKGDIVLILSYNNFHADGRIKSAQFGVFDKVHEGELHINPAFSLREPIRLGGTEFPSVAPCNRQPYTPRVTASIREIYVGQENIVERLRSAPGFEKYAEWVSSLKKPYIR